MEQQNQEQPLQQKQPLPQQQGESVVEAGAEKVKKASSFKMLVIGGVILFVVVVGIISMTDKGKTVPEHKPTAADQAQQKIDADKAEREQRQVEGLRDQDFFVRDEQADVSPIQLFRGLTTDASKTEYSWENGRKEAEQKETERKETERRDEEAINYLLRGSAAKAQARNETEDSAPKTYQQNSAARPANDGNNNNSTPPPMFVYSRHFGGAKYSEAKPGRQNTGQAGQAGQRENFPFTDDELLRMALGLTTPVVPGAPAQEAVPEIAEKTAIAEKPTQLIYTAHPPVVVNEGEMLEAALVNRLIVNVEPSPVVCALSRDLFDRSGKYVVFPANSHVLGTAQAVSYKGASRLFISFHKIILPNGLSLDLPQSSKMMRAMDETGAIGIVSHVNRHWMLQFGAAVMLGVFDGIAGLAQRNNQTTTADGMIIGRTSENFGRILDRVMDRYSSIMPTISVFQGKTMRIFISDDIVVSPYSLITDRSYYGIR